MIDFDNFVKDGLREFGIRSTGSVVWGGFIYAAVSSNARHEYIDDSRLVIRRGSRPTRFDCF